MNLIQPKLQSLSSALLICFFLCGYSPGASADAAGDASTQQIRKRFSALPLRFEANRGQADDEVRFVLRGKELTMLLKNNEVVLKPNRTKRVNVGERNAKSFMPSPKYGYRRDKPVMDVGSGESSVLTMKLVKPTSKPRAAGVEVLPGTVNYFAGRDSKKWLKNIPTYAKVKYHDVYPGVDLVYYGNQQQLEYDFIVAPGADPSLIRLELRGGVKELSVDGQGDLVLEVIGGEFRMRKPRIYQFWDGVQREVPGGYSLKSNGQVGFDVGAYDRARPLVIDPVLGYSTYLGDIGVDSANSVVTLGGAAYVTGESDGQAFVAKLNTALSGQASLVYFTVFGGSGDEVGNAIDVDIGILDNGAVYVTGSTSSTDFPTMNAPQFNFGGGASDGFVAKLDNTGMLVYSTYLGGNGDDLGLGISVPCIFGTVVVCSSASVTGSTFSLDFPTVNAQQQTNGGAADAFVTKLDDTGSFVYSSYLGGSGKDVGASIFTSGTVLGSNTGGETFVAGYTTSANFPTKNPFQAVHGGGVHDAFVAKLNAAGSALIYSTFLGGGASDYASNIAVDFSGNVNLTGTTASINFPTVNSLQTTYGGGMSDAFMTKLDISGSKILYSTYLGGSGEDRGAGIAILASGHAYVTGSTNSHSGFPKNRRPVPSGSLFDAFVTGLNPAANRGASLVFSTLFGGSGDDYGLSITAEPSGSVYVTGVTASADFPTTTGAFAPTFGGAPSDAFVAKILP